MTFEVGNIKHIFIIQSLFKGDYRSGEELYYDTVKRHIDYYQEKDKMSHMYFAPETKDAFIEYIRYIAQNAPLMQDGILIHLEMHGSLNHDGLLCSDHSLITWNDLVTYFREINIASCNALYISLASCFGRYLSDGVDPELKSPYSGYISASKEVKTEEVLQNFSRMFEVLIAKRNVVVAYLESETAESSFFYKDSKETFLQSYEVVKYNLLNNPDFKQQIMGAELYKLLTKGDKEAEKMLASMMERALNEIYERQSKAFNF